MKLSCSSYSIPANVDIFFGVCYSLGKISDPQHYFHSADFPTSSSTENRSLKSYSKSIWPDLDLLNVSIRCQSVGSKLLWSPEEWPVYTSLSWTGEFLLLVTGYHNTITMDLIKRWMTILTKGLNSTRNRLSLSKEVIAQKKKQKIWQQK